MTEAFKWLAVAAGLAYWAVTQYNIGQAEGDLLLERARRVSAEAQLDYCRRADHDR